MSLYIIQLQWTNCNGQHFNKKLIILYYATANLLIIKICSFKFKFLIKLYYRYTYLLTLVIK